MIDQYSGAFAKSLDKSDPLGKYREKFYYPEKRVGNSLIYFSGNSLGIQPKSVKDFVEKELDVWEKQGILGHHSRWISFHEKLQKNTAELIGAKSSEVVVMNALTVNIHMLLISFYQPTKSRYKIIVEKGAFPSDLYAIKSQIELHGFIPTDTLIELEPRKGEAILRIGDILDKIHSTNHELAMVMLGNPNYYTGQAFDMAAITDAGHEVGAYVGFDLAHGAGNLEMKLHDWKIDFAVWCSYKYLCAGPGAPGGIFIHKRHHDWKGKRFAGWWGQNKETRFEMYSDFDAIKTAEGWLVSNSPVMGMAPLLAAMDIFDEVGMAAIRKKSKHLTGFLESLIIKVLPNVKIITPKNSEERGCQLSLVFLDGKSIFDKLSNQGVVCDWRNPNVVRVAPHPLFNKYSEVYEFVTILHKIINKY